jgi:hypothetical protein
VGTLPVGVGRSRVTARDLGLAHPALASRATTYHPGVERAWSKAWLDLKLLPDPPTAERALKLVVREAQVGQREQLYLDRRREAVSGDVDTDLVQAVRTCFQVLRTTQPGRRRAPAVSSRHSGRGLRGSSAPGG